MAPEIKIGAIVASAGSAWAAIFAIVVERESGSEPKPKTENAFWQKLLQKEWISLAKKLRVAATAEARENILKVSVAKRFGLPLESSWAKTALPSSAQPSAKLWDGGFLGFFSGSGNERLQKSRICEKTEAGEDSVRKSSFLLPSPTSYFVAPIA